MKKAVLLVALCSLLMSCSTLFSDNEISTAEKTKKENSVAETSSQAISQQQAPPDISLNPSIDEAKSDANTGSLTPQQAQAAQDDEFGQAVSESQTAPLAAMKEQQILTDELNVVQSIKAERPGQEKSFTEDSNAMSVDSGFDSSDKNKNLIENKSYRPTPSPKSHKFSALRDESGRRSHSHHNKVSAKKLAKVKAVGSKLAKAKFAKAKVGKAKSAKALAAKHKSKKSVGLAKKAVKPKTIVKYRNKKSKNIAQKITKANCKKIAKHSKKSKREIAMCTIAKLPQKLSHKSKKSNRMAASQGSST